MWFRRRRRRSPPSEIQPSLDRLGELVARVVDLLDDGTPAEPRPPLPHVVVKVEPEAPVAPPAPPERVREPAREQAPRSEAAGWLAYMPSPNGYRLVVQKGVPPARGESIAIEGTDFRVLRLGRSPLPADGRRCAFLEGEEPRVAERTSDG